jgi:hypothetical protein
LGKQKRREGAKACEEEQKLPHSAMKQAFQPAPRSHKSK